MTDWESASRFRYEWLPYVHLDMMATAYVLTAYDVTMRKMTTELLEWPLCLTKFGVHGYVPVLRWPQDTCGQGAELVIRRTTTNLANSC